MGTLSLGDLVLPFASSLPFAIAFAFPLPLPLALTLLSLLLARLMKAKQFISSSAMKFDFDGHWRETEMAARLIQSLTRSVLVSAQVQH